MRAQPFSTFTFEYENKAKMIKLDMKINTNTNSWNIENFENEPIQAKLY